MADRTYHGDFVIIGNTGGTVTVETTQTDIVAENRRREWLSIVNIGVNRVDLQLLTTGKTVGGEISLYPGGSAIFSIYGDMPWLGAINGTAQTAATDVMVCEVSKI